MNFKASSLLLALRGICRCSSINHDRFFAPFDALPSAAAEERVKEINASLLDDGALDSYAEAVLWRLDARRAMVR
jgi:hypothetical protein